MSAAFDEEQDAAGIAAAVRSRRRSAREVLQSALGVIQRYDAQLNCFTQVLEARAFAEADATDARIALKAKTPARLPASPSR